MSVPASPKLVGVFLRILGARVPIAVAFFLLGGLGVYAALRIPDDPAIERLIVPGDPLARATLEFERLFPEGEQALVSLESRDPLGVDALRAADALEHTLAAIPQVEAHSLLDFYRHGQAAVPIDAAEATHIRAFATGTPLFRRAGLLGDHDLGIALELREDSPAARNRILAAIDVAVLPLERPGGPILRVHRVGSPWLDAWLERETGVATARFMPLFGLFLMALVFLVYRSWRALGAIVLCLGVVVAIAMGLALLFGWSNTVISTIVPLTVMVTTTSTLVYLHSRFIEPDPAASLIEHHAQVLANKFLPCTASMFACAVGFAALAISDIRPVQQMGLWTAGGLLVAWLGCFTLFPALQSLLRTPRRTARAATGRRFAAFVDWLVPASRRYRYAFVGGAVTLMLCGAAALFGVRGWIAPMPLEMDVLNYVDPQLRVAEDTHRFEASNGLDVAELWIHTAPGQALDPELLRALGALTEELERDPRITAVDGPDSVLRWARYVATGSDRLPDSPADWQKQAGDLEQILLTVPGARQYVDLATLSDLRLSIRGRARLFGPVGAFRAYVQRQWTLAAARSPALRSARGEVVGKGVLGAEITERLLPTLTQSFALTAGVIFLAFLLVFRNASARLMTMIPSLFAILTVFLLMRVVGIPLNIATILIASTVLGATENDQIHFFYHFHEGQADGLPTDGALRYGLNVAGRPILFATLINASGFLALALSNLPPMREFGIVSSAAFVLALIADFSALPAALWLLARRPARA
jgi:predicted RND superfamily exporter protein